MSESKPKKPPLHRPADPTKSPTELPEFDFGDENANGLARHVLGVKARSVADKKNARDNADLLPVAMPMRGEEFLGYFIGQRVDRDLGLRAAHYAVVGFGASEVVLGLDARMKVFDKDDPGAGVPLAPGELQRIAESGTAEQKAEVVECLMIVRSQRDRTQVYSFPYREARTKTGWQLEWLHGKQGLEADSDRAGEVLEGNIQDALDHAWAAAKDLTDLFEVSRDVYGLDYEHARIHADMGVLKILTDNHITCMYNADTELKQQIITSSVKGGALKGMGALTGEEFDDYVKDQS